jgi:hypothetical protein
MDAEDNDAKDLGFSDCMGPQLRAFVERQLLNDLRHYISPDPRPSFADFRFDWSDSCIEGHRTSWLDGQVENFSGIAIFDREQNLIAEGWMDFIETHEGLEVFWWFLHGPALKPPRGEANKVPRHIWERLSDEVRSCWITYAPASDNEP